MSKFAHYSDSWKGDLPPARLRAVCTIELLIFYSKNDIVFE